MAFSRIFGQKKLLRNNAAKKLTPKNDWRLLLEALEPRVLLSADLPVANVASIFSDESIHVNNVTVVVHGYQPTDTSGDSLYGLANAIYNYASPTGLNDSETSWLLDFDVSDDGELGGFDQVQSRLPSNDQDGASGSVVLCFDWAAESNEFSSGWTEAAGDALFGLLTDLNFVSPTDISENPSLHFIAHSFGCAVTSETVERLGYYGITVDQVTLLDPHDFSQNLIVDNVQDQQSLAYPEGYGISTWDNVGFEDVYFQTRGLSGIGGLGVPEGRAIPGAFNTFLDDELPSTDLLNNPFYKWSDYSTDGLAGDHAYVWDAYYLSTIPGTFVYDPASNIYTEKFDVNQNGQVDKYAGPMDTAGIKDRNSLGFAWAGLAGGQSKRPDEGNFSTLFTNLGDDPYQWTPDGNPDGDRTLDNASYEPVWKPMSLS